MRASAHQGCASAGGDRAGLGLVQADGSCSWFVVFECTKLQAVMSDAEGHASKDLVCEGQQVCNKLYNERLLHKSLHHALFLTHKTLQKGLCLVPCYISFMPCQLQCRSSDKRQLQISAWISHVIQNTSTPAECIWAGRPCVETTKRHAFIIGSCP